MRARLPVPPLPAPLPGALAAVAALALLVSPGAASGAMGLEALALAFLLGSRRENDGGAQLARWVWMRRPAMALWLALALSLALSSAPVAPRVAPPSLASGAVAGVAGPPVLESPPRETSDPLAPLRMLGAFAVLWAGLELLGALPATRPAADLAGPLGAAGEWMPALLPAAGFLVLWRAADAWTGFEWPRVAAQAALALAALLAVMRAATRGAVAALRWLVVFDSALAALLLAFGAVPRETALLLWLAAAGGRMTLLAAELRGAVARRGRLLAGAWRAATWAAGAALAWPLVARVGFAGGRAQPAWLAAFALLAFMGARLSWGRWTVAPERRADPRREPGRTLGLVAAAATMALGPWALARSWSAGGGAVAPAVAVAAALPAVLALWPAARRRDDGVPAVLRASLAAGATARDFARSVWRSVTAVERALAAVPAAAVRALGAPLRGLHTGDAQEYLLFLAGVAVLALLLPLLR